jgi:hypothetical protein
MGMQAAVPPAPTCVYEVVKPDTSAAAEAFRATLDPGPQDGFDSRDIENGNVLIADVDNDGTNEIVFATYQGSGSYLYARIYRRAEDRWVLVEHPPIDQLSGSHDYAGPLMHEPQLLARLCGKTIFNFRDGSEPNYYPHSVIWEGNAARRVCSAPFLKHHQIAAADLVKRGMLDEARVLLNGVQRGCEKESPAEVRAIKADVARIARTTFAASAAKDDFSWLIEQVKKNPGQQFVLDPRFGAMLVTIVPNLQLDHESLRGALKKSVWLPDVARVFEDRYVFLSGCEPHNCGNKGFIWIDTVAKQGIVMTGGKLASKTTSVTKIPEAFWKQTLEAAGPWTDPPGRIIDYIDPSGMTNFVRP